ncbi:unnamed protein product [Victoria cruziana]
METEINQVPVPAGTRLKKWLLLTNSLCLAIGCTAGPLLQRLYFLQGGNRRWLSSWLETGGWPIMLFLLLISYFRRRRNSGHRTPVFFMTSRLALAAAIVGVLTGLDDFMYSFGLAYLPVSTSALLISTQLAFTAVAAFVLVRHKFTPFSTNAVVLLTIGSAVLGLHSSKDRPKNVTSFKYYLGFALTPGAALIYGIVLPLVELIYRKAKQTITYTLVLEIQLVMSFSATAFCTVGMLVNKDFQVITREATEFAFGETKYYLVLVSTTIVWQFFFIGVVGVIFCASSLFSGILILLLLPITEILAVFFFHEKYSGEKAISLILSLWGFASYFYGEYNLNKKKPLKSTGQGEAHHFQPLPCIPPQVAQQLQP